jgi:micrococcal nuclease
VTVRVLVVAAAVSAAVIPSLARARPPEAVPLEPSAIEVVDGDTIRVSGSYTLLSGGPLGHDRIRLLDLDAPEIFSPRCRAELERGQAAAARVRGLVQSAADAELVLSGQRDKYHRPLAHLLIDGSDVATILMHEDLAIPWRPGRAAWEARGRHWCPDWRPPRNDQP